MLQLFVLKKLAQYHFGTLLHFLSLVRCLKIAQQDKLCVVGALLTFSETSPDMHCVAYPVGSDSNPVEGAVEGQESFRL